MFFPEKVYDTFFLNYVPLLRNSGLALVLVGASFASANAQCVKDLKIHGCLGNPPTHYLQFHNECPNIAWVQSSWRWDNTGQCEQGGSEPILPGKTGRINVGLCSQGAFQYDWRYCLEEGCPAVPCPATKSSGGRRHWR
jgi:hypothetical protein